MLEIRFPGEACLPVGARPEDGISVPEVGDVDNVVAIQPCSKISEVCRRHVVVPTFDGI